MNLACYHGAASTCRGNFFAPFGASLSICFSQTRASHNKTDGSVREHFTLLGETISIASSRFQFSPSVNIEQQECCVNFVIFRGSFGQFYALIEFFQCIYVHNLNLNYMHMIQCI